MSTPSSGCSRFENVALPAGAAGWSLLHTCAACAGQRRERERHAWGRAVCAHLFAAASAPSTLAHVAMAIRTGSVSCARRRRQQRTLKQSRKVTSRAVVSACSSGAVGSFSNKLSGRQERLQMILYPGSTTTTTCCMTCWVSPPHLLHDLTFVRECPSLFAPRPSASCIEEHAALRSPVLPGRCLGADRQPAGGARHAAACRCARRSR